jgi:hypothetical protein
MHASLHNLDVDILDLVEIVDAERGCPRSSATQLIRIIPAVSPALPTKSLPCGVDCSQLVVREKALPKHPCVKLAVCAGVNADLRLQAQARTKHGKQKQKRANLDPYLEFSQPEQWFREVEGGSNVSCS